ncbi:MAG: DUF1552 domain-containing protein, partial [Planctomycetes bacterium]|nr:DUF1552 domain-containing protein [Planctomycetota bacterium]
MRDRKLEGSTRRTFLRGLGTTLSLPMLESLLPARAFAAATATPPLRMAFLFVPNGVHMPSWTPTTEGADFELPPALESLAPVREKLLVLSGLAQTKARANGDGAGDHARSTATFLTGAQAFKTDGKDTRVGISVDQVAAQQLGHHTRFASLELGCEAGKLSGGCDSGYSCAYSSNISWRSPTTPAAKEVNPRLVFERLFGGGSKADQSQSRAKRDAERKSILDLVADDAGRLRRQLGGSDRLKLDEYLDGVREIELRIDRPQGELISEGEVIPPRGIPADYGEHVQLMGDLMTLAFQADQTRICSFMFADAGSNQTYPMLDIQEGHHSLSHHQNDEEKVSKIAKISRYHVDLLAAILKRLDSTPDGEGTLLDHTMLVYGSGIGDGNRHTHHDLPILLAGGGCGTLNTGRHIVYPEETPLMNLYLTMLQQAGVTVDSLGDSTGVLEGLG